MKTMNFCDSNSEPDAKKLEAYVDVGSKSHLSNFSVKICRLIASDPSWIRSGLL